MHVKMPHTAGNLFIWYETPTGYKIFDTFQIVYMDTNRTPLVQVELKRRQLAKIDYAIG
jgi:hypothetical protein